MAVFLGALIAHGITPSPLLIRNNLELVLVIAFALLASNIMTSVFGLLFTRPLTKLLDIPISRLLPLITILALTSTFVVRNSITDVFVAVLFGIFGLVLIYLNISRIPFVIAFILVGILEENYHLTSALARGTNVEAFFGPTISQLIVVTIVLSIILHQFNVIGFVRKRLSRL
jgi:putative tricarboxylic transport membrane protein